MKNTALYNDLQKYVKKIMYDRVAKGQSASLRSVFKAARENSTIRDVDMNTVGQMYKDLSPQLSAQAGKGVLDSDYQVDRVTGQAIRESVSKIISDKKTKTYREVGQLMPSSSVMNDILKMFTSDFISDKDVDNKTTMREMQDAIRKSAMAILKRKSVSTDNKTFEEILQEALRLDQLKVNDLNGMMNTMDDLFNQVSEEVDKVLLKMEASKRGMSALKIAEIDMRIEQLRNYTDNIKQGAYTLALSASEQQKVLRGIFKEKYGKEIKVNGVKKTVLDWNKLFSQSKDFRQDISDVLTPKGFTPDQIDKITEALRAQYDTLRASAQWNNVANRAQNKMLNDDDFLSRAAAQVVMGKNGANGQPFKKYDPELKANVPDLERWERERGQTVQELKDEIKNTIQNTPKESADNYLMSLKDKSKVPYKITDASGVERGDLARYAKDKGLSEEDALQKLIDAVSDSASAYRQTISEMARMNNPATKITKGDLEKLAGIQERHGFDELFNAKVYRMLGLSESDSDAGRKIEELSKKVKEILDKGGKMSKISLGKILEDMNSVLEMSQGDKSFFLRFSRNFEWWMGNRNAYRISNYLNIVENSLGGVSQMIQTAAQAENKEVAMKELGKVWTIMKDVALGGKHFDMTEAERVSYLSHEYKFDPNKSLSHNIKAMLAVIPNLAVGVLDSAAHAYAMRVTFHKSAVKVRTSKLFEDEVKGLKGKGFSDADARRAAGKNISKHKEQAIEDVADALYDDAAEKAALEKAAEVLRISRANPSSLEIRREADNLMIQNIVSKGVITQGQFEALLSASDTVAKKAIGKQSAVPFISRLLPLVTGLSTEQRGHRSKIKKQVQNREYTSAAINIMANAIVMKGIFPFINGAANWGVIQLKKLGAGAATGLFALNKKDFKKQIAQSSQISDAELEATMETYNTARNDIALSIQGAMWATLMVGAALAIRHSEGDDDEDFFEWVDDYIKELSEDNSKRKMVTRWMPAIVQLYNILSGNVVGSTRANAVDIAGQAFGYGIMESPITKAVKYTSSKHTMAGVGQTLGGIVDFGAYYNAFNSFVDLFSEPQTSKVKSHDTYLGKGLMGDSPVGESDFINGIISGMLGYNFAQDINEWADYVPSK